MDHLTFLLTGPGRFLLDLLDPPVSAVDNEARADMAVTLGIVLWLAVCLALRLAWHLAGAGKVRALTTAVRRRGQPWWSKLASANAAAVLGHWTWREAWGVAWRGQAVHLALYAGLPLLWEAARLGFIALTLPLWVLGTGGGFTPTDGALDHLRQPACWTFLTLCPGPRSDWLQAGPAHWGSALGWLLKGLWAAWTWAWIVRWRRA